MQLSIMSITILHIRQLINNSCCKYTVSLLIVSIGSNRAVFFQNRNVTKKISNSNTKESVERWSKSFIKVRHIHVAILKTSFYFSRTCYANIPFKSLTASIWTVAVDIVTCFIIQTVSTSIGAILSIISTHASYNQINCLSRDKDRNIINADIKKILIKRD